MTHSCGYFVGCDIWAQRILLTAVTDQDTQVWGHQRRVCTHNVLHSQVKAKEESFVGVCSSTTIFNEDTLFNFFKAQESLSQVDREVSLWVLHLQLTVVFCHLVHHKSIESLLFHVLFMNKSKPHRRFKSV